VNKYKDIVNLQAWAGACCAGLLHSVLNMYIKYSHLPPYADILLLYTSFKLLLLVSQFFFISVPILVGSFRHFAFASSLPDWCELFCLHLLAEKTAKKRQERLHLASRIKTRDQPDADS